MKFCDAHTETTWKAHELASLQHAAQSRRLAQVAERVASLRGLLNGGYGSVDLARPARRAERKD